MTPVQKTTPAGGLRDLAGAVGGGAIVALIALILLWRDPLLFWNDDYELSILPVFADVARSWSEGHLPLLSPYSWVCSNLAGEFQYGTFSVFVNAAVVAIWKFPLTFPQQAAALSISHLFVLGMGGYFLGRGRQLAPPFAMLVALVAALNGWIICWGAIDWFGALGAFAWFPWVWWGMERAADPTRGRWRFLWPAPFVYLLITGGFPYTVVMFTLLAGWLSVKTLSQTRRLTSVLPIAGGVLLGVGLSAPAWLALFSYLQGSAREGGDAASHLQWIVPAAALPGFILPGWTVNWADFSTRLMPHTSSELACGLVPPAALLSGFLIGGRAFVRRVKWELALLGVVLLISMLPSANVFRWSFRWLPFLHVVFAVCAAEALQLVREARPAAVKFLTRPAMLAILLTIVCGCAMWLADAKGPYGLTLLAAFFGVNIVWLLLDAVSAGSPGRSWTAPAVAGLAFLVTYLCIPANCGVPKYHLSQELTKPEPLDPERLYLSIYPPAEYTYKTDLKSGPIGQLVRPGSTSMWAGLRFVNGYSPIRPSGVARDYESAIHGDFDPEESERLLREEAGSDGELAAIGVDAIVVASELGLVPQPQSDWTLATRNEEASVFYRRNPIPSVRILGGDRERSRRAEASLKISDIRESRNRVDAALGPSGGAPVLLAFSRPFFPGYTATISGRPIPVSSYRGLIPTVTLPSGASGVLTLTFQPTWLTAGTWIALLSVVVMMTGTYCAWREGAT